MPPRRRASLLAPLLLLAACAEAPPPAPRVPAAPPTPIAMPAPTVPPVDPVAAKVDAIFADYAKPGVPGCAVGVYRAGEVVFARGYGAANLEYGLPITPSTVFEIGSMSKQFTATAILLLAADGELSLDDDVRRYIPELPSYGKVITLRHLLHHTGGLREYDSLLGYSGYTEEDVAPEAEALRLVEMQRGVNFPAGTEWSYSNTGYFLLGQVVRRVSGQSLREFSKARIFDPLGMTHTTILDDHTTLVPSRATSYQPRKGGGFKLDMSYREETGEGNVQSSIEDLDRWDANFYTPTVGGAAWLKTMRTPGKLDDGRPLTYAMGLRIGSSGGLSTEEHSGGWAGYRSHILRAPTERLAVAVLCNVGDARAVPLAKSVATVFLPVLGAPTTAVGTPTATKLSDEETAPMIGDYVESRSLEIRSIERRDGHLFLGLGHGEDAPPPRRVEPIGPRTLRVLGTTADFTFEPPAHGKSARLVRTMETGTQHVFERLPPFTFDPSTAALYAGRYRSDEMTRDLELSVKDGALRLASLGKTPWIERLTPLARDTFTVGGLGLRFVRDGRGRVAGVTFYEGYPSVHWTKVESPRRRGGAEASSPQP